MVNSRFLGFALLLGGALLASAAVRAQAPVADWAKLARYAEANQRLPPPSAGRPRVVLMGKSHPPLRPKTRLGLFCE
jgi:hypothetical protein